MRATVPLRMRPVPPPSGQVGARYEGRSLLAKAKGLRGTTGVRQSPLLKNLELLTPAARSFYIVLTFLLSTLGLNLKDAF